MRPSAARATCVLAACAALLLGFSSAKAAEARTNVAGSSPFLVTRSGDTYRAASLSTSSSYDGTLKFVVESAVRELEQGGGGTITFSAGTFDLGADFFKLEQIHNITLQGQGMDVTFIQNFTSAAADTEPFNFSGAFGVAVRDMTVSAGGPVRLTSDALDFDQGNDSIVERVKITASRGRGIIFDGKNFGWTSANNVIRDCVIDGVPGDGIELLGSTDNLIERCTITNVGYNGIEVTKASATTDQANKKSNDNVVRDNVVDNAGRDGIKVHSSDRNDIAGNRITNSGNVATADGIRISSGDSITCDDNVVSGNVANDNQPTKTQRYGLNISSSLCNRTVVGSGNDFSGNRVRAINDLGTATQYGQDSAAPSVPSNVTASAVTHARIDVSWTASTDNVGVDHYTIRRNGQVLSTVGGATTTYSDTTAQPLTTYSYTVQAVDTSGNSSAESAPPAAATTPAAPSNLTFTPVADAYVQETNPATNYGALTSLRADGSPLVRSYLRFEVQGVIGSVNRATLRIYANSGSTVGHDVRSVAANGWVEGTVNYSNAPAFGGVIRSSGAFSAATWVSVDITPYISGNGVYSLALTTPHTTAVSYGSRESSNAPQLVVTT